MSKVIFLSHAGADSPKAATVANELVKAGIEVRFDLHELRYGASFLTYMESALSTSDYCLLLWSRNAASTEWVRLEWEAALYRSVQERRSFLVTGLLEDIALPAMVAPRLRVDLYPALQPGLGQIIEVWLADREAESQSHRPVASVPFHECSGSDTIYIASEMFGITVPLRTNLEEPVGLYLDHIITGFNLPKVFDYEGRAGVRFNYRLMNGDHPLNRALSFEEQKVKDKTVLWLETTMTPYSQSEAIFGKLQSAGFRGGLAMDAMHLTSIANVDNAEVKLVEELAREAYVSSLISAGLGEH